MLAFAAAVLAAVAPLAPNDGEAAESPPWGHSAHGESRDEGPRSRPWVIEGIGSTHFPVTSVHPEVQAWFDQGVTLLHGFWWYEAERAFRWCIKLDPECAMAYWGAWRAIRGSRGDAFLDEALARRDLVTEREQRYLDVAAALRAAREAERSARRADPDDTSVEAARDDAVEAMMLAYDELVMNHPDDVEAKALYFELAAEAFGDESTLQRYAVEAVLDDILAVDADHVGAMHYRIHNWDGEQGSYVVDTCMALGELAPGSGHLLHMPGHVLSSIGLWHEAAISMDAATRVEKATMHERLILPEHNWDYGHNLDYLCYIQEQLGMVDAALLGAAQLDAAPRVSMPMFLRFAATFPRRRALLKFERWDELLDDVADRGSDGGPLIAAFDGYARARALIGKGQVDASQAALEELRATVAALAAPPGSPPDAGALPPGAIAYLKPILDAWDDELSALLALERGEHLDGLGRLAAAAEAQVERWDDDPPHEGQVLFNVLGDAYLELGAPLLAVDCYERTLELVRNDGFALAGLVVAHDALGHDEQAAEAMARLGVVWSGADPNRWLDAARATGVVAAPRLDAPIAQRDYRAHYEALGPSLWVPGALPELAALDADGDVVTLADQRGHNVLLVFYLGDECVHCMEQIQLAEERLDALADMNTVVLAVSKDTVDELAEQQPDLGVTLLSDEGFENARRFRSYDDFEDIELHSTFLVDADGRLRWSRIGGEPFTDFDALEDEIARMNAERGEVVAAAAGSATGAGAGTR